jgi:hypothetical protein
LTWHIELCLSFIPLNWQWIDVLDHIKRFLIYIKIEDEKLNKYFTAIESSLECISNIVRSSLC